MAANKIYETPMLDVLEEGPWPSFITGIKNLRDNHESQFINDITSSLLGQLEHSYETRKGYWKGGTVSVFGYGGGIIPRFSEVAQAFPESKEFHTLRKEEKMGFFNKLGQKEYPSLGTDNPAAEQLKNIQGCLLQCTPDGSFRLRRPEIRI